jgi:predicted RNA-binding Zn-ribbon protein involved in translation (DUF1610 family)
VSAGGSRRRAPRASFECPNCGADVVVGAKACRECGSDANTGWHTPDEIDYAQVDLPDGYRDERDPNAASDELPPTRTPRWVWATALVMATLLIAWFTGLLALLL